MKVLNFSMFTFSSWTLSKSGGTTYHLHGNAIQVRCVAFLLHMRRSFTVSSLLEMSDAYLTTPLKV